MLRCYEARGAPCFTANRIKRPASTMALVWAAAGAWQKQSSSIHWRWAKAIILDPEGVINKAKLRDELLPLPYLPHPTHYTEYCCLNPYTHHAPQHEFQIRPARTSRLLSLVPLRAGAAYHARARLHLHGRSCPHCDAPRSLPSNPNVFHIDATSWPSRPLPVNRVSGHRCSLQRAAPFDKVGPSRSALSDGGAREHEGRHNL